MLAKFSEFKESTKSLKHGLASFKDPVCYLCFAVSMVASWSVTKEIAGSNSYFKKNVTELRKNSCSKFGSFFFVETFCG